jgi:hypothetical protein
MYSFIARRGFWDRLDVGISSDDQLAIVLNGLMESYRYLVVAMELQLEAIDFDDLTLNGRIFDRDI